MHGGDYPHREAYHNAKATIEQYYIGKDPIHLNHGQQIPGGAKRKYVANREADRDNQYEKNAKTVKLTKSYLRSEIVLNQNTTTYPFAILDTQTAPGSNGQFPTEQRLKQQDVFFVYKLGFYLLCSSTAGGNTSFQFELMTFPNPNFFSGFGAGVINLDLLTAIWETGVLQVQVNNNVITPAWDMKQHFVAPFTQINGPSWPAGAYFNQMHQNEYGYSTVEPNWMINGGNNNQYVINYPQPLSTIGMGGFTFRLVLDFQGFLAQNCSSIMDN